MDTFSNWLKRQVDKDTPIGDLARDSMRAKDRPRGNAGYKAWRAHLYNYGVYDGTVVFEVFEEAWKQYCSTLEPEQAKKHLSLQEKARQDRLGE